MRPLPRWTVAAGLALALCALDASAQTPGAYEVEYASSVDGELLETRVWVPSGYEGSDEPVPLLVYLHGGGATGSFPGDMAAQLDARGWLGLAPHGRAWGLDERGCPWTLSAAYVDSADPAVGPGERDILDAIDWAEANLRVDPDRVYLTGFSMGGRGAYAIGLKHPQRFAALGAMAPIADTVEHYTRRPEPCACFEGIAGGAPGDGALIDTMYALSSGRFLLENAHSLPVFHAHGSLDPVVPNALALAPFQHGRHLTIDASFDACHETPADPAEWGNSCYTGDPAALPLRYCAGPTPTLASLAARHPGGYAFAYLFTPHGHTQRDEWHAGAPAASGWEGVESPPGSGHLIGLFDFLAQHEREPAPPTVVYKSYTSEHRRAYWLELDSSAAWSAKPAAVRARRAPVANRLELELVRAAALTVDLEAAQLALTPAAPLALRVEPLVEPAFDPALAAPGEPLAPTLVLRGGLVGVEAARVLEGGLPLDASLVELAPGELRIGPLALDAAREQLVLADGSTCAALPNSVGPGAQLTALGSTSAAANDLALQLTGAPPGQAALFFYGAPLAPLPFGAGQLCVGAPSFRFEPALAISPAGGALRVVDNTAPPADDGPGALLPGASFAFQVWYRDPAGAPPGFNTSAARRLTFVPDSVTPAARRGCGRGRPRWPAGAPG